MIPSNSEMNEQHSAKRMRYNEPDEEYTDNSHKFKGVVPQQNGHWGAQIYAKHQRIWLGTFKTEREAAMAYDSASIKLRNGESHRNFPWKDETVEEPRFQSHYSVEAVVNMIRNGTYPSKFSTYLQRNNDQIQNRNNDDAEKLFSSTQLFQKVLTPSDVGKLNRLVIPKKHAVTYFPCVWGCTNDDEVVFYDKFMRLWKFRYCYWSSSQSFVFTRGWNRFVKDKKLKAKDIVAFYICEPVKGSRDKGKVFSFIDVIYNDDDNNEDDEKRKMHCSSSFGDEKRDAKQVLGNKLSDEVEDETQDEDRTHRGLRLFGVSIN